MADAPDGDIERDLLRAKYSELTRKYAEVVDRLNRKANQDLAIYRLGAFGLRAANTGLAMVADGQIQVSNARFNQLARSVQGALSPLAEQNGAGFADLRHLVLAHSARMLEQHTPVLDIQYTDDHSEAIFDLRFERNVRAGQWAVTVTVENVTDRSRRDDELARTREALLKRERLRVLGELAASVAHDLGNTLRGASFQLATLRQGTRDGALDPAALQAVSLRVEIASEAIARLHGFARTGLLNSASVRLDQIVMDAAALVESDFRASVAPVEIKVDLPDLPTIRGSGAELSLLFVNLLRNARDAMPEGGTVTIAGRQKRNAILVTVADEGTGLTSVRKRLFEPFFTTKGAQGTGLGLWLAAGTMKRLGGRIDASNRPGGGAIFTLTFPLESPTRLLPVSPKRRGAAPRGRSAPAPRPRRRVRRSATRS